MKRDLSSMQSELSSSLTRFNSNEDLVEQIKYRARYIEGLADTLAHKEMREMFVVIKDCFAEQKQIRAEQDNARAGQAQIQSAVVDLQQSRGQTMDLLVDIRHKILSEFAPSHNLAALTSE